VLFERTFVLSQARLARTRTVDSVHIADSENVAAECVSHGMR